MGVTSLLSRIHRAVPSSASISLPAAESLFGKSKRTLWRRLADGTLPRAGTDEHGRVILPLTALLTEAACVLPNADWETILAADAGDSAAECEVAMRLMEAERWTAAQYWLEHAAKRQHAEAMHWLAVCCFYGWGRTVNEQQAMVWLARAAALGHPIAQAQLAGLRPGAL